jgi:hypothetical protein
MEIVYNSSCFQFDLFLNDSIGYCEDLKLETVGNRKRRGFLKSCVCHWVAGNCVCMAIACVMDEGARTGVQSFNFCVRGRIGLTVA